MGDLSNELQRAIRAVGARARISERVTSKEVIAAILRRFGPAIRRTSFPAWEQLEDSISVQEPQGWRRISEFCTGRRCLLAFDPDDERVAFEFDDGEDIARVIEECYGLVFYVTDDEYTFVLCFNDHDFLIGAGAAKDSLALRRR